ncbi:hypothetical protein PMIN06_010743 [Paraphaeosphaeria minitans]
MDVDGLPPPSISRAPRELLELQKAIDNFSLEDGDFDDEAAPPPIQRPRTTPSRASPSDNVSKSPVAPKRLASSPKQPTPVPRFATPPTWMVAKPYPQYNDLISVPTRAPPPEPDRIPPLRVNTYHSSSTDRHAPPLPSKNPRRSHFEPEPLEPSRPDHARNFSHPLKKQLNLQSQTQPQRQPKYANTASFRHPPRPVSFRNSSRTPYSMRRWSSLDTIDSVQTTQETSRENSIDGTESMRTEISSSSKRQYLSFDDGGQGEDEDSLAGDIPGTPPASSVSLPSTPSDDSRRSSASNSLRSISTTTQGSGSKRSTTASLMRRLKGNKTSEPLLTPESLEVEKRASLDQSSRTNSSNSTMTISSGRPSEAALPGSSHGSTSQLSVSSKEWKSSNFDTSGLTQAELKKCKKKGINPALYAEMKAARKGRFVSPIGGNTFI